MSKMHWTPAQRKAIDYKGDALLLSAAAGSGKTATLTERIARLLTDGNSTAEISRMLCVTFTRAAAAELRERIGRKLSQALAENPGNSRLVFFTHFTQPGSCDPIRIFFHCQQALGMGTLKAVSGHLHPLQLLDIPAEALNAVGKQFVFTDHINCLLRC